jgi:FtsZ-interacting cell division protein ZipA
MMDTNTLWIVVVAAIVIVAIMLVLVMSTRRRRTAGLKEQFGPEYKHAVDQYGGSHKAEQELQARQKRVGAFDLHPLAPGEKDRFAEQWKQTQAEFVDAPDKAVADADHLVKQVMQQRGYPVGDFEQRAADISVDNPNVVTHYRTAHEIALKQEKGTATTEDLRQAMVHYRALFDLLQTDTAEKAKKDNGKV